MFASLFRKQKSASTIRCGSPRRARLGVENLEDRTVPSTLLGNLGSAGDGAYLLGGASGGVLGDRTEQVSVSVSGIRLATIGEEIPSLLGGASGGVLGDRTEQVSVSVSGIRLATIGEEIPSLLGGASGGVLGDRTEQVSVSVNGIRPATIATPKLFGGLQDASGVNGSYVPSLAHIGEEIPQ